MNKMKAVHWLFFICNILGVALEYFLLYTFLNKILEFSTFISSIITVILLVSLTIITVYTNLKSQRFFIEKEKQSITEYRKQLIEIMKKKYFLLTKRKIDISFINTSVQPSVMFALMGNVYINTNKRFTHKSINDVHFEGVLSHELGHILHMPNIYMLANIRPTAILGNFMFILTYSYSKVLGKKENKFSNFLSFSILYLVFIFLNIINIFVLYPFKKYEELQADKLSLSFSNGYSLRGYYYKLYTENQTRLDKFRFNFIDFNHPSPKTHYLKLKSLIGNEFKDCELYSSNNIKVTDYSIIKDNNLRVRFYEKVVDKNNISMYLYIGNLYQSISNTDKAKEYYLLAGQKNILNGYRKLIKILKEENNTENVMEYYKVLSKNGDREAKLYTEYYEKQFVLYKLLVNGEEVIEHPLFGDKTLIDLKLFINDCFIQNINKNTYKGIIKRKNKQLQFIYNSDTKKEKDYYFDNDEIISRTYEVYDKTTESYEKFKEYYKKMS